MFLSFNNKCWDKPINHALQLIVCMLILASHSRIQAVELTYNGFATLGVTYAKHDQLNYRSTLLNRPRNGLSFTTDSVVGAQVNAVFDKNWESVAQVVIQDRADAKASNYIEKAFVRYKINRNWAMRLGRMDSNFYMLSDFRAVGYAYPWARPPVDFYSGSSVAAANDGIDIQYTTDVGQGVLKLGLLLGESKARLNGESGKFYADFEDLFGFNIEYTTNNLRLKTTYATATISDFEFGGFDEFITAFKAVPPTLWPQAPMIIDAFEPEGDKAEFVSAGFKYDNSAWQVQAEIATFSADWILFPNSKFGYLSVGYSFNQFLPYVLIAANRPDAAYAQIQAPELPSNTPPELVQNIGLIALLANDSASNQFVDQNTLSAGVRWDFADEWVMKFQVDHIRMRSPGSGLFGNNSVDLASTPLRLNVVHFSFSTVF